jgi:hypothetical protein
MEDVQTYCPQVKRVLAGKAMEVDSFKGALQKVEARRQKLAICNLILSHYCHCIIQLLFSRESQIVPATGDSC